jgi:hypothetical protein
VLENWVTSRIFRPEKEERAIKWIKLHNRELHDLYFIPNVMRTRLLVIFRNKLIFFYGEELLAPGQTPKLEDHPLSGVRNCLFNIFVATFHIWGRR